MTPVVHAHWIPEFHNKRDGKAYRSKCSECGGIILYNGRQELAYCPYCGAKMIEGEKIESED